MHALLLLQNVFCQIGHCILPESEKIKNGSFKVKSNKTFIWAELSESYVSDISRAELSESYVRDISRFSPRIDQIFPWDALNPFFEDFPSRNFVQHKCSLVFDAEQVYLKPQVTNLKNKEVTVRP